MIISCIEGQKAVQTSHTLCKEWLFHPWQQTLQYFVVFYTGMRETASNMCLK